MSSDRHADELAQAIRDEDDVTARQGQTRDATRIRHELAEARRLERTIDDLLHEDAPPEPPARG